MIHHLDQMIGVYNKSMRRHNNNSKKKIYTKINVMLIHRPEIVQKIEYNNFNQSPPFRILFV